VATGCTKFRQAMYRGGANSSLFLCVFKDTIQTGKEEGRRYTGVGANRRGRTRTNEGRRRRLRHASATTTAQGMEKLKNSTGTNGNRPPPPKKNLTFGLRSASQNRYIA